MTSTVEVNVGNTKKIFPEYFTKDWGQTSLADGESVPLQIQNIKENRQILKMLKFSTEQVSNVFLNFRIDGQLPDPRGVGRSLHAGSFGGIGENFNIFGDSHVIEFATEELELLTNNRTGSASSDFRGRIEYIVDAFTTAQKESMIARGLKTIKMTSRDLEVKENLKRAVQKGVRKLTFDESFRLGIGVPQKFEDFLKIHEVYGARISTSGNSFDLTSSFQTVMDQKVKNRGDEALVLESIFVERPAQAELGEVTVEVKRDDDGQVATLDPANISGNLKRTDWHIHALERLQVNVKKNSGTHNSFKIWVVATRRRIGVGFKAKINEFLGENDVPDEVLMSQEEKRLAEREMLFDKARAGLIAIG